MKAFRIETVGYKYLLAVKYSYLAVILIWQYLQYIAKMKDHKMVREYAKMDTLSW